MKTNAITRIIIWSLVLVLLIGLLVLGLYRPGRRLSEAVRKEPMPLTETIVIPAESQPLHAETTEATITATAVNIRTAPNSDSQAVGMLKYNDTVIISRQENINGEPWAYITHPSTGWVKAEFLKIETNIPSATSEDISLDPRLIREIDIEWAAGSITVQSAEVDTIQVIESAPSDSKYPMVWKQHNDKLTIRYSENTGLDFHFGITLNDIVAKDLTILVPMGWECDSLEVAAASATLDVKNLVIREVDFDGASGTCDFENCIVDELDLDTASGDIRFFGSLKILDCDAASASVTAVFDNIPNRIDMDSMSGDLDITLPSSAGFTVSMDGLSTDLISDFGYSQSKDGSYYRGNGECKISMDAVSGNIYLREYKQTSAAHTEHHHTDACTTNPDSCPDNSTHHTEPHH